MTGTGFTLGAALARAVSNGLAPLQVSGVDATGGSPLVALLAVGLFFVAVGLSVLVTYHFVQGYRRTKRRPMALLAVGMFLLAAAPMFVRLLFGNTGLDSATLRTLLVALSELSGLLTILYVVYEP